MSRGNTRVSVKLAVVAALVCLGSFTAAVLAANAHFVSGPTITAGGRNVTACGKIAGLGNNENVTVVLTATGRTTCTNRGGNVPPGQTETVDGSAQVFSDENGQVSFCVTTRSVSNPCPSSMTPRTTFSDFSVRVYDANGNQILP